MGELLGAIGALIGLMLSLPVIALLLYIPIAAACLAWELSRELWSSGYLWSVVIYIAFFIALAYIVYVEWPTYTFYHHEYVWQ